MSIILETDVEKEFEGRLGKNPYCTDNLNFGLQIRSKKIALGKRYIQANTPFNLSWFCFDIDYPNVLQTTFRDNFLPTPNIMITNPENLHCHLLYGIRDMVHLSDNSHIHPIQYAHMIQYALRKALKADPNYSGLIIKNPNHGHWITTELNPNLWSLGEMNDFLILPHKVPAKEMFIGLGRNCTLFELSRHFAYSEVLKYKTNSNKDNFYNAILSFLNEQNKLFSIPLSYNEFKAIAKSVTKWTWRYYGDKTTKQWVMYVKRTHGVDIQSWRGKRNTSEGQSIKGKLNTTEAQSLKGKLNTSEVQSLKGKLNTTEAQSLKGKLNTAEVQSLKGKLNTTEAQSLKGKLNTAEAQSLKGKIGGINNTFEVQSLKGKSNTSEIQSIKAKKSAIVRYEGSAKQLKPWEELGISRSWYYTQKSIGAI